MKPFRRRPRLLLALRLWALVAALLVSAGAACRTAASPSQAQDVRPAVTVGVTLLTATSEPPTPVATATPTPTPSPSPAPAPIPPPPPDPVHTADWTAVVAAETGASASGIHLSEVLLLDLTGDGADEAVVTVSSGGTAGNIALFVYTGAGGRLLRLLARREPSISGSIDGGVLVSIVPAFSPADPRCCPSYVKRTTYRWTGTALEEAQTQLLPNPQR